jgi:hypothetical protein
MFLPNLLNVLVQIANKMGLQKKNKIKPALLKTALCKGMSHHGYSRVACLHL